MQRRCLYPAPLFVVRITCERTVRIVRRGVRRDRWKRCSVRPDQVGADPVRKVSIIRRSRSLGVTLSTPEMDRYGYNADYLRGRIIGALGGVCPRQ